MKAPDKIYVPQHNIEAGSIQELDELIVAGSTEYIRKDALMEMLLTMEARHSVFYLEGKIVREIINKLNFL